MVGYIYQNILPDFAMFTSQDSPPAPFLQNVPLVVGANEDMITLFDEIEAFYFSAGNQIEDHIQELDNDMDDGLTIDLANGVQFFLVNGDFNLDGALSIENLDADEVLVINVTGDLNVGTETFISTSITGTGGPNNIFWMVDGAVNIGNEPVTPPSILNTFAGQVIAQGNIQVESYMLSLGFFLPTTAIAGGLYSLEGMVTLEATEEIPLL